MDLIKKILLIAGVILVLIIATGLLLPVFVDVNDYKNKIEQLVEDNIGRKLTLQGDLELKTFPFLKVKTGGLTLANPQGFPRQNMLEIESAEIGIRLLPLIFKKVEAGTIKFESPVINLTKKSSGEANWNFSKGTIQENEETAMDNSGAGLAAIAVQGFEITNAQVNFADLANDTILSIDELDLLTGSIIPGSAFPLEVSTQISGSMITEPVRASLRGEITIDGALENLVVNQLNSTIYYSDSTYEISSPDITFQIPNNRLTVNRLSFNDLTDPQTQATMVVEKADVDIDSLIANFSKIEAGLVSEGLSASLEIPNVEFDTSSMTALIASSALSVKNPEFNMLFSLPETSVDLTKSEFSVKNLSGKFSYNNLSGAVLIPDILFDIAAQEFNVKGIESVIGDSTLITDVSGGLSPLDVIFNLNIDNFNLKEILKSSGVSVDTSSAAALTNLNLKLSGSYEQDSLVISEISGKLDETTIDGIASIPNLSAPSYQLNLNLGNLAIDDYLPKATSDNSGSDSETLATAAAAPVAMSQFDVTSEITVKRIYSNNNNIALEDIDLRLSPENEKSSVSFKSLISGAELPEPVTLNIDMLAYINTEKSTLELTRLQINAKGKTIAAGLEVPLLVAPFTAENITIENIAARFSNQNANSHVIIPSLSYSTANSSLVIDDVTGVGIYNEIEANIILPNLSFELDSSSLKINELALDLSGKKPVGRLSIPTLEIDMVNKRLGPTNIIFEGQDGRAQINLKSDGDSDNYAGNLLANDFNLRGILNRFNLLNELQDKTALTRINIQSPINLNQSKLELENIKASIDDTKISGHIEASFGLKPVYDFSIMIGELNADRYIPAASEDNSTNYTKAVAAPVAIPVELFKDTTAIGDVHFDKLLIGGAEFSDFYIGITSKDGRLSISPIKSNFFNGRMNGDLAIDSAGEAPRLDFDYKLTKVSLEPALTSLGITKRLAGNGDFSLKMGAVGNTDREMTSSIKGNSSLSISNGAIKGINIQDILFKGYQTYAALKNKTVDSKYNPADQTEFSSMTGTWNINAGVISGNDLQIQAPLFRIDGKGSISLINNSINYLLNIKVVKSLEGQGGKSMGELEGRTVPLSITGDLANPEYGLDISSLAKAEAQKKVEEKIQEKIENKLGEKLEDEGTLQEKIQKKAVEKAGEKLLDLFNKF